MTATAIVRAAIAHTPYHHIDRLYSELAERSPTRGDCFLRNLTPELVESALLNAQWEPCEGASLASGERLCLARGILGVAGGRRTAHVTVLLVQGADGHEFLAWCWAGDYPARAGLRAA
jgi:hypothetical protein